SDEIRGRQGTDSVFELLAERIRAVRIEQANPSCCERSIVGAVDQALLQQAIARIVELFLREAVLEHAIQFLTHGLFEACTVLRGYQAADLPCTGTVVCANGEARACPIRDAVALSHA